MEPKDTALVDEALKMAESTMRKLAALLDASENRFVKLREEHSDLEQEMADLRTELAMVKEKSGHQANVTLRLERDAARKEAAYWSDLWERRPWWKRIFG